MKKRIAICLHTLTLGGAEVQSLMWTRIIKKFENLDIVYFGLLRGGNLEDTLKEEGIKYEIINFNQHHFHKSYLCKIKEIYKVIKLFRKHRINYVIPFTYYPNLICLTAAIFCRIKNRFWNQRGMEHDLPYSKLERFVKKNISSYIGNSVAVKDYLINRFKIKDRKIQIIPNVYYKREIANDRIKWRNKLQIELEEIVVIMIANFFEVKDHLTAVKALSILTKKFSNIRFIFSGFAPDLCQLYKIKSLAFDLGITNQLIFVESNNDISGLLDSADIGILCTPGTKATEGSPNAILDYMLSGLPIVATNIPAIKELFEKHSLEYLYEAENEISLAEKLIILIENKELRTKIGQQNYDYVRNNHQPDILIPYMKDLLKINK